MKPAQFSYVLAESPQHAVEMLQANPGEARLLAGGQSLMPMLSMRVVRPSLVIDINRLPELDRVEESADGLRIGALARYSAIERSGSVAGRAPLLAEAVRLVGDRQIRNRGTIGGSLAQGDPSGEVSLACMILGAEVIVLGPSGTRRIAVEELYEGPYATVLAPDEMITHVSIPDASGSVCVVVEHVRRHGDFAVVAVAADALEAADGSGNRVRLGLSGIGPRPLVAHEVSTALSGRVLDQAAIASAASACLAQADPSSDVRASAAYRLHLVPVMVERALQRLEERRSRG